MAKPKYPIDGTDSAGPPDDDPDEDAAFQSDAFESDAFQTRSPAGARRGATLDPRGTYAPPHNTPSAPAPSPGTFGSGGFGTAGFGGGPIGSAPIASTPIGGGPLPTAPEPVPMFRAQEVHVPPSVAAQVIIPQDASAPVRETQDGQRHYVQGPTSEPSAGTAPRMVIDTSVLVGGKLTVTEVPIDLSRAMVQLTVLIETFAEAAEYDPARHHNRPPPELWLDNTEYLEDLRALLVELRRLNDNLEKLAASNANKAPPQTAKEVGILASAGRKFFEAYAAELGKRAANLTALTLAGLLGYLGAEAGAVDAIFEAIKKRL